MTTERVQHRLPQGDLSEYVVGVFEILGGLGVLFARWRRAASLSLGALMMSALCTHVVHAEFPRVIPPLALGGVAFDDYTGQPYYFLKPR